MTAEPAARLDCCSLISSTMYPTIRTLLLSNAHCWDADSKRSCQDLFEKLDANKDGRVDVAELRAGLKAMGIFRQGAAQFSNYLKEHEKKLRLTFKSLDRNNDGRIDASEIQQSLAELGLDISKENALKYYRGLAFTSIHCNIFI
ncbi:hypothetical protein F7725_011575 [Dissostichus mawsoni]|uniref:EF-hand domain-containing protein n=1 Tax=Dissostichus mawsoni TaxID=36200 RepID=A0A7J5Z996_DISMA|nr:hypothetical protein F7725_011575 [Dissostichus mawsoni]